MLNDELELAISLARSASERILEYYALEILAEEKLGADNFYEPVTEADKEASSIIVHGIADRYPEDAVLSEEEIDERERRLSGRRVWVVDPIDGTAGFVKKDGDFAVQIGLSISGRAVLGVVMLPFHGVLYYATDAQGAFSVEAGRGPTRLRASDITDFSQMTVAVSRNHPSKKMSRIIEEFGFKGVSKRGSVGLKVGLIAESVCDIYIHPGPRTKLWDTCGPEVILRESGGLLTDIFGSPIRYDVPDLQNHNGLLATNGTSHDDAVRKLRPVLREFGRARVVVNTQ